VELQLNLIAFYFSPQDNIALKFRKKILAKRLDFRGNVL